MPIEYRDSLRSRHGWMVRKGIECQGRAIERPDIEHPFCNNVSSWEIDFFVVDEEGIRAGGPCKARLCTSHLNRLVRKNRIELVGQPQARDN